MLSAGAMARHEKGCNQNSNNWHMCFKYCVHLMKSIERVYDEDMPRDITHFICAAKSIELYSYKFEKAKGFRPVYTEGKERMPLKCDFYVAEEDFCNPWEK